MPYGLLYKTPENMEIAHELQRRRKLQEMHFPSAPFPLHHPSSLDGGIRYHQFLLPGTKNNYPPVGGMPIEESVQRTLHGGKESRAAKAAEKFIKGAAKTVLPIAGALVGSVVEPGLGTVAGSVAGSALGNAIGGKRRGRKPKCEGGNRVSKVMHKIGSLVSNVGVKMGEKLMDKGINSAVDNLSKPSTTAAVVEDSALLGMGRREDRNAIVKKIMQEKGLSMVNASKYVKEHKLYVGQAKYKPNGGRAERNAIVMKIKQEKGLTLMQASKYVKDHGLYKPK